MPSSTAAKVAFLASSMRSLRSSSSVSVAAPTCPNIQSRSGNIQSRSWNIPSVSGNIQVSSLPYTLCAIDQMYKMDDDSIPDWLRPEELKFILQTFDSKTTADQYTIGVF
jgi:hypothetical protein